MRDFQGLSPQTEEDPVRRIKWQRLDWFLRDLSQGMGRIQKGLVPDGSGDPIGDQVLSDIYLVLKGRTANQDAHGGTLPGGTLTLSSTLHPTKGMVYLGDAKQTAYDEVNERIGINQPVPAARLHIKHSTGGGTVTVTPTTDYWTGGWGVVGTSDFSISVQAVDGSYSRSSDTQAGIGVAYGFTTFNTSSSTTGWTLNVVARCNTPNNASSLIGSDIVIGVGSFTPGGGWTGAGGTGGTINTGGGGPVQEYFFGPAGGGRTLAANVNTTYTRAMSVGEMGSLFTSLINNPGNVLFVQFVTRTNLGDSGATNKFIEIDQIYFSGPGVLDATPFQKWENPSTSNSLNYVADGNNNTSLTFTGDRIAVSASAFALSSGAGPPAAGMIVSAQDSIGTMHWSSASALATLQTHRFVVNGRGGRPGALIDGAWTPTKALTLSKVRFYRKIGGSASSVQFDLTKNGTTMLSAPVSIAFNANGGASATADATISVAAIAAGDEIAASAVQFDTNPPANASYELLIEAY